MTIYLKEVMKRYGIKQKELAEQLGVLPNYIAKLQSGERKLTNEWVLKLTQALNCEAWELSDDEDYFFSQRNLKKILGTTIVINDSSSNSGVLAVGDKNKQTQTYNHEKKRELTELEEGLLLVFDKLDFIEKVDAVHYVSELANKKNKEAKP